MIKLFEQWLNEENSRLTKKVKKHFDQKLQGLGYNTPDFQWTLMTWLKYALHDANFHDEAKKVEGFFPKAKKSKLVGSPIEKVQQDEGEEIAKWADWDGHDIIDAFVKYMDTIYLEKIGANIQTLKESVNEKKEEGLIFNPSSQKDLNKMRKALEDSNLYAEFDKKEGYFLFPEDSDRYDELEAEIEELTRLHDISGYIESIDINEGVGIWPQSKLSVIFQFNLDEELKKLKKGRFYVIGYDLYHNDKKILTIDPDKDGVYKIVDKVKKIKL